MAKQESVPYLTPWMKARFPKMTQPDTKGQFADGKFKTDAEPLTEDDLKKAEADLLAIAKEFWPKVPEGELQLPIKDFYGNKEDRKAKKNKQGRGLVLKSKYRPALFDGKKKKLPESVKVGGGTIFRCASFAFPWTKTTKVKGEDIEEFGIGLRLGDCQIRKLVEGQAQGDGSAFDEDEEGFTYEGAEDGDESGGQFGSATDL